MTEQRGPLTPDEIQALGRLFDRLTPAEARMLAASRDQIAALPPDTQRALGREVAKLLHNRGTN